MEEETLALGQRWITPGVPFVPTTEEQALLDTNNVNAVELESFVTAAAKPALDAAALANSMTITDAIGGLKGKTQEEAKVE